jgi:hypothetical protein
MSALPLFPKCPCSFLGANPGAKKSTWPFYLSKCLSFSLPLHYKYRTNRWPGWNHCIGLAVFLANWQLQAEREILLAVIYFPCFTKPAEMEGRSMVLSPLAISICLAVASAKGKQIAAFRYFGVRLP